MPGLGRQTEDSEEHLEGLEGFEAGELERRVSFASALEVEL
jgi:hypothetical protein